VPKINRSANSSTPAIVTAKSVSKAPKAAKPPSSIRASSKSRSAPSNVKKSGKKSSKSLDKFVRNNFKTHKRFAILRTNLEEGKNLSKTANLTTLDLARPHRTSFHYMSCRMQKLWSGAPKNDLAAFHRWTERLLDAQMMSIVEMEAKSLSLSSGPQSQAIKEKIQDLGYIIAEAKSQESKIRALRDDLETTCLRLPTPNLANGGYDAILSPVDREGLRTKFQGFLDHINSLYVNVSDLGPHSKVNARVQEHFHLHSRNGALTPASLAAGQMTPDGEHQVAVTADGKSIIETTGKKTTISTLDQVAQKLIAWQGTHKIGD
jgi:hypothetical protein